MFSVNFFSFVNCWNVNFHYAHIDKTITDENINIQVAFIYTMNCVCRLLDIRQSSINFYHALIRRGTVFCPFESLQLLAITRLFRDGTYAKCMFTEISGGRGRGWAIKRCELKTDLFADASRARKTKENRESADRRSYKRRLVYGDAI